MALLRRACGRRGADQAHDLVFLRPGAVVVMVYPYRNAGHSRFRPAVRRCAALRCAADVVFGFGCGAAPLLCAFVFVFTRLMRCFLYAFLCFCVCLSGHRVYEPIFKPLAYFARVRSIEVPQH